MSSDMKDLEREFAELDDLGELDSLDNQMRGPSLSAGPRGAQTKETLRVLPVSIAAVALCVFAGIVWYAYSQGVTSGRTGEVPLLVPEQALKVLPEDPGGLKVPHQDKLVYNQMANEVDDSQVERLLAPPEQPIKPPAAKPEAKKSESDIPPIPSITGPIAPKKKSLEPLLINPDAEKEKEAAEEIMAAEAEAVEEVASAAITTETESPFAAEEPKTVVEEKPAPAPAPVQSEPETTVAAPKVEEKKEPETLEVASVAKINKVSDWRVQIGAVSTHQKAVAEFQRLQKKNRDLIGDMALEVMQIQSNGKDFFRIRIGPLASSDDAIKLCSDLKARGSNCLTVKPGQ